MEHMTIRKKTTPKQSALTMNTPVSEWTARRALHRIGLIAAIKQKKPALYGKNVVAGLKFCKTSLSIRHEKLAS